MSGDVTSERFHGSSSGAVDHDDRRPAGALARRAAGAPHRRPATPRPPSASARATRARSGTPARRHRSTSTSRACQVGVRSSCSASSCSSTTTAAASPGHGAQAADARPDHDVDTAGARLPSRRAPRPPTARLDAADASSTTWSMRGNDHERRADARTAARIAGITSARGGSRSTPPPTPSSVARRRRRRTGSRAGAPIAAAARRRHGVGRGRDEERPERRPPTEPMPTRRARQVRRRAVARDLGDRLQPVGVSDRRSRRCVVDRSDPAADPPAVELDPHERADADVRRSSSGTR